MLSIKTMTTFIVSFALFMDVLDGNVVNTAIPVMSQSFHINPIDLKIALISYLLNLAIFIPMSGWTADKYGTKNIFILAIGLFTVSSFFCGQAQTLMQLVIARSVQGIGGAFMISLGRLIIARTFKKHELMEAMNTVIIVVSMGVMLGPFVGGVIVDHLSWPWIFWINIPAGIFAILIAAYFLKDIAPKHVRPFDFFGFILLGGSLAMLLFSLAQLSDTEIDYHRALLRILVAVSMFIAYLYYSKNRPHPVAKLSLISIPTFRISVFGNLLGRLGFGGVPFLLPLLQQLGLGFSAQLSGFLLAPIALGVIFSKVYAINLLRKMGYKKYLLSNTIVVGLSLWLFDFVNIHTPPALIALFTFIFGLVISAQYTGMNSLAYAEMPEEELSASTSITSTVQVLSQSIGVAVAAMLLRFYSFIVHRQFVLTPTIFHLAFFTLGIFTFISMIIFMRLKPEDGKQMLSA